ncbi:MAG: TlpA disulfide reductase family protein [Bacteroidota bacterium]
MKRFDRFILMAAILLVSGVINAQKTTGKSPAKQTKTAAGTRQPVKSDLQIPEGPFMLKGFAPAFPDSLMVMVTSKSNAAYKGPATFIKNGQFLLSGTLPEPGIYNLLLTNPKRQQESRYIDLFLANEPSAIRFTGNSGDFEVLEGASLKAFAGLVKNFGADFDSLSRLQQMKQAPTANQDSLNLAWATILERVKSNVPLFVAEHKASPVAPFLLCTIWPVTSNEVGKVDKWLQIIDSAALENDFGAAIKEYVNTEKQFGYGQPAPDFIQNDPNGQPVELSSFRGKYVLVDFWASWCGPCRQENPNLVNAFNKFKSKNFTVLGVSLDKDKPKWLQAIQQDQLTWTHVSDLGFWNNAVAKLYRIQSIPQNFVLDPEGKIIGKNLRGEALDSFLNQLLGK